MTSLLVNPSRDLEFLIIFISPTDLFITFVNALQILFLEGLIFVIKTRFILVCVCVCVCVCFFFCLFVCLFVCPACIKVLGEHKTTENVVYLFICGVYQESKQF